MTRKQYLGNASATTLSSGISAADTSISVVAGANLPSGGTYAFVVVFDLGSASEEKVLIQSRTSNTLTVAASGRGYDGTTATTHSTGATVNHCLDANTVDEANDHVNTTSRDDHTQYYNSTRGDARYAQNKFITYGVGGTLATGAGVARLPIPVACTIIGAVSAVNTAPTGATIIVDINKNGTTIFSTQANRPTIAISAFASQALVTPNTTALAAGDYLTIDVDQIGSSVVGADLTVTIALR